MRGRRRTLGRSTGSSWAAAQGARRSSATKTGQPCLADTITPRFPDGLSVIDVAGQGTNADGTIEQERTKMLLVLVPPGDETALNRMNEIGAEYQRRFTQDAVLRVINPGLRRIQVDGMGHLRIGVGAPLVGAHAAVSHPQWGRPLWAPTPPRAIRNRVAHEGRAPTRGAPTGTVATNASRCVTSIRKQPPFTGGLPCESAFSSAHPSPT